MAREDFVPLIIGGDWSTYPIAREFYEAFGDEYLDEYCPHVMMRKRLRTVTVR